MKKVVAIYHKDCNDGTAAAAVVLKKYPDAKVFPFSYSYTKNDIDRVLETIDSETEVYTVDGVFGAKEILSAGYKVTTIDHHIGAKEEYEKIALDNKNFNFIYDNSKSGASFSWKYFFPEDEVPELIKLVEDSDLFIHKFGKDTKDVRNYLSIFQNEPEKVVDMILSDLDAIKEKGSIISLYSDKKLEEQLETLPVAIKVGEHLVQVYNIPTMFRSDGGRILSTKNNATVGVFSISGDTVKISFRGVGEQFPDALTLAKTLGGGGHKRAAAVFISLDKFLEMIVK